ncbi:hypothetical protein P9139_11210 [Curtobacterium flaccumfaciens]|nr:hypothetical protein P9139_11210 [Curtobacterium flaccumfaciens]
MPHISTIVTRRGLVRRMDGLDVTSLLRTTNLEDLADLLGVPRRVIGAHFPTRRGYVLTVFDSRDARWNECLGTALRDHGTVLGLERALRDPDRRMPLLEFTTADAPGPIDDSSGWAWTLQQKLETVPRRGLGQPSSRPRLPRRRRDGRRRPPRSCARQASS